MSQPELPFEQPETPAPIRVSNSVAQLLPAAIKKFAGQDQVRYDFSLIGLPDENGELIPFVEVYLEIPGKIKDTMVYSTRAVAPYAISKELIDNLVKSQLKGLRNLRVDQAVEPVT